MPSEVNSFHHNSIARMLFIGCPARQAGYPVALAIFRDLDVMPIGHDKLGQFVAFYKGFVDFLAELREFGHFQSPVKYRILLVTKIFPKQFTKNSSTFGVDEIGRATCRERVCK